MIRSGYVRSWLLSLLGVAALWPLPTLARAKSERCGESLRTVYCDILDCDAARSTDRACLVLTKIYRAQVGFSILCNDHTLRLFGPFDESEIDVLNQELALFTQGTGIPVQVEGVDNVEDPDRL